ncbi:MAG: glycosyltransferase family 39 protein [Candidatus Omnitrophota bacterium]
MADLFRKNRLLFFILFLSLAINIIGLTWGLPENWHPDNKVKHIAYCITTEDLNPHLFINPSFYIYYLLAFCKIFLFFVKNASYSSLIILCRILTALIGTCTVFITYLLSKNIFGVKSGLYSALFLALSAGILMYSHFTIPEIMATFFIVLTLYYLSRYVDESRNRYLYYSAMTLGLAISTKYTAILLFIFIILGMFFVSKKQDDRNIQKPPLSINALSIGSIFIGVLSFVFIFFINDKASAVYVGKFLDSAGNINFWNEHKPEYIPIFIADIKKLLIFVGFIFLVVFPLAVRIRSLRDVLSKVFIRGEFFRVCSLTVIFFCIGTPFAILDYKQFLHDMFLNWQVQRYCLGFTYAGMQWGSYFKHIINLLGIPIFACSVLGMFYVIRSKDIKHRKIIILFSYVCLTYMAYGSRALSVQRYILPIVPGMAIFAGALFGKYLDTEKKAMRPLKSSVLGIVIAYSFFYSLSVDLILLNDSRYKAGKWIEENITKDSPIGVFSYNRYLPNFKEGYKIYYMSAIHDKDIDFDDFLAGFKKQRFDYLVLSDMFYGVYIDSDQYPERKLFYEELFQGKYGYEIIADFKYRPILEPVVDFANPKIVILKNTSIQL